MQDQVAILVNSLNIEYRISTIFGQQFLGQKLLFLGQKLSSCGKSFAVSIISVSLVDS